MKSFKKIFLLVAFLLSFGLASCQTVTPDPNKYPQLNTGQDIANAETATKSVQTGMGSSATNIDNATAAIRQAMNAIEVAAPKRGYTTDVENQVNNVRKEATAIDAETLRIRQLSGVLEQANAALDIASSKVTTLQTQLTQAETDRDTAIKAEKAAQAKANAGTQAMLSWLIILCVIGIGAGVAVIFLVKNTTIGITIIVASGTVLVLSIVLQAYFYWVAIGGLVLIAGLIGYVIYEVFVQKKAITQVVATAEIAKRSMPVTARRDLFGYGSDPGKAFSIQDAKTEKIVAGVRKQLSLTYNHTINDPSNLQMDAHDSLLREQQLKAAS